MHRASLRAGTLPVTGLLASLVTSHTLGQPLLEEVVVTAQKRE